MERFKVFLEKARDYFGRFTKRKKKDSPRLKVVNKKRVNLAVVSGLIFILLVGLLGGIRAMTLSNKVSNLEKTISDSEKSAAETTVTPVVDNRLQYYLNDFVYWYFNVPADSEGQTEQAEKLSSFYGGVEPDVQSQGQVKNRSELDWSRLLIVQDNVATYEVHYIQTVGEGDETEEKEIATAFSVPYEKTEDGYYISGLPWFTSLSKLQDEKVDEGTELKLNQSDNISKSTRKKLDKFLKVFFVNYTTEQDNLNLIAKNVKVVENTSFKTLDYTYYKTTKKGVVATVQVTFSVAGSTHSENFTLTLSKKGKSYYVNQLEHVVLADYAE